MYLEWGEGGNRDGRRVQGEGKGEVERWKGESDGLEEVDGEG